MGQIETQKKPTKIEGVFTQDLMVLSTEGGDVLHFLRKEYALMPHFPGGFGEVYFSEVLPGKVKAWKRHARQNQVFAVPYGRMKIVLYDDREHSRTKGVLEEIILGRPENYALLSIPAGIWYGFAALSREGALLCNCADIPHEKEEGEKIAPDSKRIPYIWETER